MAGTAPPSLWLYAENDSYYSPAAIRRAAGQLPHAELLMFDDSGHEILCERDEVRLKALARIDDFLPLHAAQ